MAEKGSQIGIMNDDICCLVWQERKRCNGDGDIYSVVEDEHSRYINDVRTKIERDACPPRNGSVIRPYHVRSLLEEMKQIEKVARLRLRVNLAAYLTSGECDVIFAYKEGNKDWTETKESGLVHPWFGVKQMLGSTEKSIEEFRLFFFKEDGSSRCEEKDPNHVCWVPLMVMHSRLELVLYEIDKHGSAWYVAKKKEKKARVEYVMSGGAVDEKDGRKENPDAATAFPLHPGDPRYHRFNGEVVAEGVKDDQYV